MRSWPIRWLPSLLPCVAVVEENGQDEAVVIALAAAGFLTTPCFLCDLLAADFCIGKRIISVPMKRKLAELDALERIEELLAENNSLLKQNIFVMKSLDEKIRKVVINTS